MTVAELIAVLQNLPGDLTVVVDGYEGGLTAMIKPPHIVSAALATREDEWIFGEYAEKGEDFRWDSRIDTGAVRPDTETQLVAIRSARGG